MLSGAVQSETNTRADATEFTPPWDVQRQAWVLRPARAILVLLWAVLLGFGAAAGVASYLHMPLSLVCTLGGVAVAAGVGLLLWRKAVLRIDNATIVARQMLGTRVITMYHDEVVDVRYSPFLRSFVIIDAAGQRIYFSTWVRGVKQAMKDMAIRHRHLRYAAAHQF